MGKLTHRYNPTTYTSRCPSCECAVEDFRHAFCCPARKEWQSTLRHELLKVFAATNTDQSLQALLLQGLDHWFRDTPIPLTATNERYNPLVESQGTIGWHNHQNQGVGWTSKVILVIWFHFYDEWLNRNQALHGSNQQSRQNARRMKTEYKGRSLYKSREKCARSCQLAWFYQSADEHFQREK